MAVTFSLSSTKPSVQFYRKFPGPFTAVKLAVQNAGPGTIDVAQHDGTKLFTLDRGDAYVFSFDGVHLTAALSAGKDAKFIVE